MRTTILSNVLSLTIVSVLAACGGTNPAKDPANHMNVTLVNSTESIAGDFVTIEATVSSSPAAVTSMNWTIQKTANSPDAALLNADCKVKSVSSSGSTLSPTSTWKCAVNILTPINVTEKSAYKLVMTAVDAKGNSSFSQNTVTVSPNPTPAPTVSITGQNAIRSGDFVNYLCQAVGGTTAARDKYTYQWVIQTRDGLDSLSISTPRDSSNGQFVAPAVSSPKTVVIGCRATDDSLKTGIATQTIIISPAPEPRLIPQVVDGTVIVAGQTYRLDGSRTSWFDHLGNPIVNKEIYFNWTQKTGSVVSITNPTSSAPSILLPVNPNSSLTNKESYVFTMSVSDKPFINGVSTGNVQSLDAVYYVSTLTPITLSVTASSAAQSGTIAQAGVTAIGQSGYPLFYSWTQVSGPTVTIGGNNTSMISFLAPPLTNKDPVPLVFRVMVSYVSLSTGMLGVSSTDVVVAVVP